MEDMEDMSVNIMLPFVLIIQYDLECAVLWLLIPDGWKPLIWVMSIIMILLDGLGKVLETLDSDISGFA